MIREPFTRRTYAAGLIGAGIGASLSPALHEREARRLGLEGEYRLFDLEALGRDPGDVGAIAREARDLGLAGVNVTHPCKQLVVPELDELSPEAAALNAVNTVVFDGDRMVGHNTDTTGFQEAFRRDLETVALDRVVVLGAGGAGAAVAHAMLGLGAGELAIADVEAEPAGPVANLLGRERRGDQVGLEELHLVEARARGGLELLLERAAQAHRCDRAPHVTPPRERRPARRRARACARDRG